MKHYTAQLACVRRLRQGGQSLLEFALIMPVLLLMLVGVVYIAQGFNLQLVLTGAAFEGAKIWAKGQPGSGVDNCTPPACDPNNPNPQAPRNFASYVVPAVRRYVRSNGFDEREVRFFKKDAQNDADISAAAEVYDRQREFVRLTVLYPFVLPIGNFAQGYDRVWVSASCTMKRGS